MRRSPPLQKWRLVAKSKRIPCPKCGQKVDTTYHYGYYECNCGWYWQDENCEGREGYAEKVAEWQAEWVPLDQRPPALDFLEQPLTQGDFVTYVTGGTSARLVLAHIKRIEPYVKGRDGFRGDTNWRLVVNRIQEGTRKADDESTWWQVDKKKEVRVDQLHRVIKITPPAWAERVLNAP